MGILTRKQGEQFVISSDRVGADSNNKRAPRRPNQSYLVWTGSGWSVTVDDGLFFESIDQADEYVRANYAKLST
jgi:hypothetical protein